MPRALTPSRRRALLHGLVLGGWLFVLLNVPKFIQGGLPGRDAITYWIVDPVNPYRGQYGEIEFFPYSPPAALIASTFDLLPWPMFLVLWWALQLAVLAWIGGSWRSLVVLLAIPPVFLEVLYGNIHVLLAAAVVLGFRWPVTWSLVLLTKVTPGIGLIWFAVRREWRPLAVAVGASLAVCGISLLAAPQLWPLWFGSIAVAETRPISWGTAIAIPLPLRLAAAIVLVVWGALTDRRWTVPVAATLALPVLWTAGLSMLVAVIAVQRGGQGDPGSSGASSPVHGYDAPDATRDATRADEQVAPDGHGRAAGVQRGGAHRPGAR